MDLIPPSGVFCFNYTAFDQATGLSVQASIYDVSTGSPVFLTTVNLSAISTGAYTGNYMASQNKTYLVAIAVFTDGTYSTVDVNRPPVAYCFQTLVSFIMSWAINYGAYDMASNLNLRAAVYDMTTGSPVFVQNVAMVYVIFGIYFGVFSSGVEEKTYIIETLVYTDGTFSTVDTDYSAGVDNFTPLTLSITNLFSATLVGPTLAATLQGQTLAATLIGD